MYKVNSFMIIVLRLNHRISRDKRLSTHVALTARAFLADKLYYSGQKDSNFELSINKVTEKFGSSFSIDYLENPIKFIQENKSKFTIIHLTCYGLNVEDKINEIKKNKNLIIIVGGEKVEPIFYNLSKYNLSVTQQPISEVSALAIFLHLLNKGKELKHEFENARLKIIPMENGKKVLKN